MSLVDRTNAWLMRRIRDRHPSVAVRDDAIVVTEAGTERRYPLQTLMRVAAWQRDVLAGTVMTLRLGFADGAIEIGEADPAWDAVVAALDATGRLDPSHRWKLALIARAVEGEPLVLL